MATTALTGSSLTWKDVIANGDASRSTVTLDSSSNAITVSGTVEGEWGSNDSSINGLTITGSNPVTLSGSGTLTVTGAITANSNTIIDGITVNGNSSVSGGTVTIQGGGTLIAQSVGSNVVFGATTSTITNTLQLNTSSATLTSVSNLSPGDEIDFVGNTWDTSISWTENSDGTYALKGSTGDTLISSVSFAKKADGTSYTPADFGSTTTSVAYNGGTSSALTLVCFLAGSMIETPVGDVPVDLLKEGDQVIAYVDGSPVSRPVVWSGHKHVTVRNGLPDDEAGYPVRILKDAIADGVPYKDMLITGDHCLFFDGSFIPVRMLVNGRSIFFDRTLSSYTYYHVETPQHAIIRADGVLTESYLDTGNRNNFVQDNKVIKLRGRTKSWEKDAAAPLTVTRATVEALFFTLQARAQARGVPSVVRDVALTHDADLRLVTSKGKVIRSMRVTDGKHLFMIPPGVEAVRILSRTTRPCDVHGPFVDDRRHLGVLVGNISLQGMRKNVQITSHLTTEDADGWSVQENLPCRWTTGNALLPLHVGDQCGILSLQILASGPYSSMPEQARVLSVRSV
ncbi:Hint domain-containing protein [Acetobacter cerevisiae]|uniref:Hint domain-containing protein n=1 Tax=Acetobacter cerevisiae TaxID=178900 RepID=UPI000782ACAB|nr:Hint domain-containing protein [Acetobacter cerevisiae]